MKKRADDKTERGTIMTASGIAHAFYFDESDTVTYCGLRIGNFFAQDGRHDVNCRVCRSRRKPKPPEGKKP